MTSIGERLIEIRRHLALTQRATNEVFGLGENTWQRLEREDRAPKGAVLVKLVSLGISSDWLLTGEGNMRRRQTDTASHELRADPFRWLERQGFQILYAFEEPPAP